MSETLLPCPFCGKAPTVEDSDEPTTDGTWPTKRGVYCYQCEYEGPSAGRSGWNHSNDDVIAAWNRRAPAAPPASQPIASYEDFVAAVKSMPNDQAIAVLMREGTDEQWKKLAGCAATIMLNPERFVWDPKDARPATAAASQVQEREPEKRFPNQIFVGPTGLRTGDKIEIRGSITEDGETEYGEWFAAAPGLLVDWGFIVAGDTPGLARKWEDEGKTWRRIQPPAHPPSAPSGERTAFVADLRRRAKSIAKRLRPPTPTDDPDWAARIVSVYLDTMADEYDDEAVPTQAAPGGEEGR